MALSFPSQVVVHFKSKSLFNIVINIYSIATNMSVKVCGKQESTTAPSDRVVILLFLRYLCSY
jgi:hypothetical protein